MEMKWRDKSPACSVSAQKQAWYSDTLALQETLLGGENRRRRGSATELSPTGMPDQSAPCGSSGETGMQTSRTGTPDQSKPCGPSGETAMTTSTMGTPDQSTPGGVSGESEPGVEEAGCASGHDISARSESPMLKTS